MITYNEAKQLLDQGIFPCLIINNEVIDYIVGYTEDLLTVTTFSNDQLSASSENSELSFVSTGGNTGGGTVIVK